MDRQRLSIAMCTYNGAKYIQEQLDSIAAQTRLPYELVVCDDRSSDRTVEIVKSFAAKVSFPVSLHINEENLGIIKNFEKAIGLCTGDIIALCDQDDVWKPNKIEKILKAFAENPDAGYVFSNAELVNENLSPIGNSLWKSLGFKDSFFEKYRYSDQVRALLKRNCVWGATMAFKSSLNNLILPISTQLVMHDAWIALLASCAGFYGVSLSDSLLYYRQHAAQQVGGGNTLQQKYKRARNPTEIDNFKKKVQGLLEAKERLLDRQNTFNKDISGELNLIQQKADHFSNRVFIHSSSNFLLKGKAIVSEMLTGRYHYFSNSWQSVAKDLLF